MMIDELYSIIYPFTPSPWHFTWSTLAFIITAFVLSSSNLSWNKKISKAIAL